MDEPFNLAAWLDNLSRDELAALDRSLPLIMRAGLRYPDMDWSIEQNISRPLPRQLLTPLFTCLSRAWLSPKFPSGLLELLAPVLRQRLQLLYDDSTEDNDKSWLRLLCWDQANASDVAHRLGVEGLHLNPVSGEVDFANPRPARFKRCDEETLLAKIRLKDLKLEVIYIWLVEEREGVDAHWKVHELRYIKEGEVDNDDQEGWYLAMFMADEAFGLAKLRQAEGGVMTNDAGPDAYWDRYASAPDGASADDQSTATVVDGPMTTEAQYYAQYGQVQPVMDNSEEVVAQGVGHSGLMGGEGSGGGGFDQSGLTGSRINHLPSASDSAVKQHISESVKHLYELATTVGMGRDDFNRFIMTELNSL